jgi:lactoylglutathione lyase
MVSFKQMVVICLSRIFENIIKRGSDMKFTIVHNNLNVFDLQKSLTFYKEALGLIEIRRHQAADGSFTLVFLGEGRTSHQIELTWLRERTEPYNLGDNEIHLAFQVDDYAAAYQLHQKMGCICFENKGMGIYFIEDPDGYWLEIIPQ